MQSPKSNHVFSQIPSVQMARSAFRRDRTYKTTFNSGYLVPIYLDEVLPGDTYNLNLTAFARLATPVVPVMDNLYMDFQFFFVPNRLLWENWERMCGAQDNPGDSIDYLVPQYVAGTPGFAVGSLADYFGIPVSVANLSVNALPFRAYNLIYNEFYRDENLQDSLPVALDDGPDSLTYTDAQGVTQQRYDLRRRGKRKDYFTSALPWPQKGPGVELPLGDTPAPIGAFGLDNSGNTVFNTFGVGATNNNSLTVGTSTQVTSTATNLVGYFHKTNVGGSNVRVSGDSEGNVYSYPLVADLSNSLNVTINTLRQAFQLQRLLERDARGGTRYFELLVSHFGVRSPDARLQRPEYLGGGTVPINVHSVTQTSSTDSTSPQGNLAAVGYASSPSAVRWSKSFVEHGYIIGLVSVRADLTYQQGLHRLWSRRGRYDFYWPVLAHLGEQAILNKEIYCQGTNVDDQVFAYQERYAEYRYGVSQITGKLRSGIAGSLDVWHLSQYFTNLPTLSAQFIEDNPPVNRVLAVQNEPEFIYDSLVSVNCVRAMPVYSVPGLVDHF